MLVVSTTGLGVIISILLPKEKFRVAADVAMQKHLAFGEALLITSWPALLNTHCEDADKKVVPSLEARARGSLVYV